MLPTTTLIISGLPRVYDKHCVKCFITASMNYEKKTCYQLLILFLVFENEIYQESLKFI